MKNKINRVGGWGGVGGGGAYTATTMSKENSKRWKQDCKQDFQENFTS